MLSLSHVGACSARLTPLALLVTVDNYANLSSAAGVAALIDHTLLKAEATQNDIAQICREAREYQFATVCVNPYWVRFAAAELRKSGVKICTVTGFPLGANRTRTKLFETETAVADGASEIDMVLNIGALRSGQTDSVQQEIEHLAEAVHRSGALLKVILETALLDDQQKRTACELAVAGKADFVKTSTGFSSAGATLEDVRLMREVVKEAAGVKASGGIRTLAELRYMVVAGANRIGTSSGVQIVKELQHG
jgi:deoxyribose-phosphate aldolase